MAPRSNPEASACITTFYQSLAAKFGNTFSSTKLTLKSLVIRKGTVGWESYKLSRLFLRSDGHLLYQRYDLEIASGV
ncbi:4962_t:CDS:2 [Cetraspora pellucida]|uniref:4962_t:CDS:1 n=1 Tax=Cetraspora pellucida TaxID=1433469 RepID=A0ACA9L3S7_9GLOM|nr:4962_t:CDS:2 [Cetraspora pellucida]